MSGALQEQRIGLVDRAPQGQAVYEGPVEQIAILATREAYQDVLDSGYKWDPSVVEPVGWESRFHEPITINRFDGTVYETPRVEAYFGYMLQYIGPGYAHRTDVPNLQLLRAASRIRRRSIGS